MEKLLALANGGLDITLQKYGFRDTWSLRIHKDDDGINLTIEVEGDDLETVIADAHERWVKTTGQGIPTLSLKQIEHTPTPFYRPPPQSPTLDDEIPF